MIDSEAKRFVIGWLKNDNEVYLRYTDQWKYFEKNILNPNERSMFNVEMIERIFDQQQNNWFAKEMFNYLFDDISIKYELYRKNEKWFVDFERNLYSAFKIFLTRNLPANPEYLTDIENLKNYFEKQFDYENRWKIYFWFKETFAPEKIKNN